MVIVTRPEPQCQLWVSRLQDAGLAAVALPLLRIAPAPNGEVIATTVKDWLNDSQPSYRAVMLVSGAAVEGLWAALGNDQWEQLVSSTQQGLRFWVTGPASAQALMARGVNINCIDQPDAMGRHVQFDSQTLWHKVGHLVQNNAKVMIVRGVSGGRVGASSSWLEAQLIERTSNVTVVETYQRLAPAWDKGQLEVLQRVLAQRSVWLLTSVEAMSYLPRRDWRGHEAVVTHPRQREAAVNLGFGQVHLSDPRLEQVIASLKSIQCQHPLPLQRL